MNKVVRKEFAKMCGVSVATIHNNTTNGKLISEADKKIDTENPTNLIYLKERQIRSIIKNGDLSTEPEAPKTNGNAIDYSTRKQLADTLKAEADARLKELQAEKLMGKLIPVEMVQQILKINIQGIFRDFENDLVKIASIYCDTLAGGDRSKLSEVTKKMRDHLVKTIERAKTNTAQEVKGVVDEYSEARGRSERK